MVKPTSGNKPCPDGYTYRKGYTRKLAQTILNEGYTVQRKRGRNQKNQMYTAKPRQAEITVPPSCAKNKSNSGKGILRKGTLIKYGYSFKLADSQRHKALLSAIEAYGKTSVYNRLNTVAALAKKSQPNVASIFLKDRDWVQGQADRA